VDRQRAEEAFNVAMNAAQAEMKEVIRDAINPETKKPYARLETIDRQIRPIITKYGFALTYGGAEPRQAGAIRVTCHVMHSAGHSRDYELEGALDTKGPKGGATKTDIQGLGSSVSYLRKYLKLMIFDLMLADEDNDGRGSSSVIDETQANNISTMMDACNLTARGASNFLKLIGVERIEDLPAHRYEDVMQALRQKLSTIQERA
jgi:hypothetical protein